MGNTSKKEKVSKYGRMAPSMRVGSKETRLKVLRDSFMQMVTDTKGCGSMAKLKERVYTLTSMDQNTKVTSSRISWMVMGRRDGQMESITWGNTKTVISTDRGD